VRAKKRERSEIERRGKKVFEKEKKTDFSVLVAVPSSERKKLAFKTLRVEWGKVQIKWTDHRYLSKPRWGT
jgi:hypothetical protein